MTKKAKRKPAKIDWNTSPCCGQPWTYKSRLLVCSKCYRPAEARIGTSLVSNFGQVIRPGQAGRLGDIPVSPVDDEEPLQMIPGRARELKPK